MTGAWIGYSTRPRGTTVISTETPVPAPPSPLPLRRARFWPIVTVLGTLLLLGVTWAGRRDFSPPAALALATFMLPFLYALAGVLLAVPVAIARSRVPRACLAVVLGVGAILWLPGWVPRHDDAVGTPITVLTWNVHRLGEFAPHAQRKSAEAEALECVAKAVEDVKPDALAVMEISSARLRVLQDRLSLECEHIDYYGTHKTTAGGLAVCVRKGGPLVLREARNLPMPPEWHYVFTELDLWGKTLNFVAVHFKPLGVSMDDLLDGVTDLTRGEGGRLSSLGREIDQATRSQGGQVDRLLLALGSFKDPTLLAGDFNSTRDAAIHVALRKNLVDIWERAGSGFGATRRVEGWLPLRIDYLYATRRDFGVVDAKVLDAPCSDHLAVVGTVGMR